VIHAFVVGVMYIFPNGNASTLSKLCKVMELENLKPQNTDASKLMEICLRIVFSMLSRHSRSHFTRGLHNLITDCILEIQRIHCFQKQLLF
jgi:hypothetical protein